MSLLTLHRNDSQVGGHCWEIFNCHFNRPLYSFKNNFQLYMHPFTVNEICQGHNQVLLDYLVAWYVFCLTYFCSVSCRSRQNIYQGILEIHLCHSWSQLYCITVGKWSQIYGRKFHKEVNRVGTNMLKVSNSFCATVGVLSSSCTCSCTS